MSKIKQLHPTSSWIEKIRDSDGLYLWIAGGHIVEIAIFQRHELGYRWMTGPNSVLYRTTTAIKPNTRHLHWMDQLLIHRSFNFYRSFLDHVRSRNSYRLRDGIIWILRLWCRETGRLTKERITPKLKIPTEQKMIDRKVVGECTKLKSHR